MTHYLKVRNQRLNNKAQVPNPTFIVESAQQKNDSTFCCQPKEFQVARFRGQDCKLIDAFLVCIIPFCNLITILSIKCI